MRTTTSCGCLKVVIENDEVSPGELLRGTADIRVGAVPKSASYGTRVHVDLEGGCPPIVVAFHGTVHPDVVADPAEISLDARQDADLARNITIRLRTTREVVGNPVLTGIVPDWIRAVDVVPCSPDRTLPEKPPAQRAWDVTIATDLKTVNRRQNGQLAFELEDGPTTLHVVVPYQVESPLRTPVSHPSQFFCGTVSVGKTVTARVVLTLPVAADGSHDDEPTFTLRPALQSCGGVELRRLGPGKWLATLTMIPDAPGAIQETIRFDFANERSSLVLPVVAQVTAP